MDGGASVARIPIRFGRLKPVLVVVGLTPRRSYLELSDDVLRVRMSWGFSADIPRASVRSAQRGPDRPWSIGVHGWRGRWIVNGAASPIVSIRVEPPARARTMGFPASLRELLVSVDDPNGLVMLLAD